MVPLGMTRAQLRRLVQADVKAAKSLRAYARDHGLSTAARLCQFLKRGTRPDPALLKAIGYRRVERETYEPQPSDATP